MTIIAILLAYLKTQRKSTKEIFNCHNSNASTVWNGVKEKVHSQNMIAKLN